MLLRPEQSHMPVSQSDSDSHDHINRTSPNRQTWVDTRINEHHCQKKWYIYLMSRLKQSCHTRTSHVTYISHVTHEQWYPSSPSLRLAPLNPRILLGLVLCADESFLIGFTPSRMISLHTLHSVSGGLGVVKGKRRAKHMEILNEKGWNFIIFEFVIILQFKFPALVAIVLRNLLLNAPHKIHKHTQTYTNIHTVVHLVVHVDVISRHRDIMLSSLPFMWTGRVRPQNRDGSRAW